MKNHHKNSDHNHMKHGENSSFNGKEEEEKEPVFEEEVSEDEMNATPEENLEGGGELGILRKQIENLEKRLKDKEDEILRRAADTDNYRKRLEKEANDRAKYANQAVVSDFIKVFDNIELTLQYTEKDSKLHEGIELTIKSFADTLGKYGVTAIIPEVGEKFNPAFHEGVMLDNNQKFGNDIITLCLQKGYVLNDRVIRPAKVRVNKI